MVIFFIRSKRFFLKRKRLKGLSDARKVTITKKDYCFVVQVLKFSI